MTSSRNNIIDLLRFLAAFAVCIFHFNEPIPFVENSYRSLCKYGWLGVPVFFVISGYCIVLSANNSKNVIDFLIRRFFRIFPPYWFSLIVVLISVAIYKIVFGQNSVAVLPKTIQSICLTIALLTDPFSKVKGINWVYWSLTVELFFYLVIAVSMYFKGWISTIFILLISLAAFLYHFLENLNIFFFLKHWSAFGIGISLYFFNLKDKKTHVRAFSIFVINLIHLIYTKGFDNYTFTVLFTFLLIAISIWIKDLPNNIFSKLGDYSYSVYLLHVPIGIYLFGQLKNNDIQNSIVFNIVFDVLTYLIVAILAYFSFKFIELPFISLGKKIANKANVRIKHILYPNS